MAHPDRLSDLPLELFELIAEDVKDGSKEDLTSLRQAGTRCAAKVMKLYKECRFTRITAKLSDPSSIRRAIQIVDDNTIGPAVRTIKLIDDTLDPEEWELMAMDEEEEEDEDEEEESASTSSASTSTGDDSYAQWYRVQRKMRETGEDHRLLSKLFSKCGLKEKRMSIVIWSHREACVYDTDVEEVAEDPVTEHNDHCFIAVMLAIISSDARFHTFSMNVGEGQGIPISAYGHDFQKGVICKAALSRFRTVHLVLDVPRDENFGREKTQDFLGMMAKAQKIRSLKVVPLKGEVGWPAVSLLMLQTFPSLQSLEVDQVSMRWVALVSFLKRQKVFRELVIPKRDHVVLKGIPRNPNWETEQEHLARLVGIPNLVRQTSGFRTS